MFVVIWLDYCNTVLFGITKILLHKLQSVLNAAARLVTKLREVRPHNDDAHDKSTDSEGISQQETVASF